MSTTTTLKKPSIVKITNNSTVAKTFVPYRENFYVSIKSGVSVELETFTPGQVLYYLEQADGDMTVTQIEKFDAASSTNIVINVPTIIKIQNTSTVSKLIVPYRENFTTAIKSGNTLEFGAETAGQALYYLSQATDGLAVAQLSSYDTASTTVKVVKTPAVITLTNAIDKPLVFQPYRENFAATIPANDIVKLQADTLGQVLYYYGQGIDEKLTVADAPITLYSITPTLTNVTGDLSNATTISNISSEVTLRFTAASGKTLPSTVSVTGASSTWNQTTGTLGIYNPTANVTFTIAGV